MSQKSKQQRILENFILIFDVSFVFVSQMFTSQGHHSCMWWADRSPLRCQQQRGGDSWPSVESPKDRMWLAWRFRDWKLLRFLGWKHSWDLDTVIISIYIQWFWKLWWENSGLLNSCRSFPRMRENFLVDMIQGDISQHCGPSIWINGNLAIEGPVLIQPVLLQKKSAPKNHQKPSMIWKHQWSKRRWCRDVHQHECQRGPTLPVTDPFWE